MSLTPLDLPKGYLKKIQEILGDDLPAFLEVYRQNPVRGLCFNMEKVRSQTIESLKAEWNLRPVSWCPSGWYYEDCLRPGLSPYHDAGVFYIQEPGAMAVVEAADIKKDDLVLDLCASPGGKTAQAAAKAKLLVSNEPISKRARILSSNIERMGFDNCIVTSAYPKAMSGILRGFFDVVLVDAPCSGEGMMRKDELIAKTWSYEYVRLCAKRQAAILEAAAQMVSEGGKLVYSTCTFEKEENEDIVYGFLSLHPEFRLLRMFRLWPHREETEGHFVAVVKKGERRERLKKNLESLGSYLKKEKIHVLRSGILPGKKRTDKKGQSFYIPSHAEAMSKDFAKDKGGKVDLVSKEVALKYLHGESLDLSQMDGIKIYNDNNRGAYVTVYFDMYPLGNARIFAGLLKNLYPKGLRRT